MKAFADLQTFRRLNFTSHRNLLFTFHPTAVEPNLGRHKVLKATRWEMYLSAFSYTFEHLHGEPNILADLMTRWMRGYRRHSRRLPWVSRVKSTFGKDMVPTAPASIPEWPLR